MFHLYSDQDQTFLTRNKKQPVFQWSARIRTWPSSAEVLRIMLAMVSLSFLFSSVSPARAALSSLIWSFKAVIPLWKMFSGEGSTLLSLLLWLSISPLVVSSASVNSRIWFQEQISKWIAIVQNRPFPFSKESSSLPSNVDRIQFVLSYLGFQWFYCVGSILYFFSQICFFLCCQLNVRIVLFSQCCHLVIGFLMCRLFCLVSACRRLVYRVINADGTRRKHVSRVWKKKLRKMSLTFFSGPDSPSSHLRSVSAVGRVLPCASVLPFLASHRWNPDFLVSARCRLLVVDCHHQNGWSAFVRNQVIDCQ